MHIPSMLNDSIVTESVGGRFETMHMAREDFYKMLFYEVLDKFLAELKDRFIDHRVYIRHWCL